MTFATQYDSSNASEFEQVTETAIERCDRTLILGFERLACVSSAGLRAVFMQ